MEINKLIDNFGDDVFALALMTTKSFESAKEIFVRIMSEYSEYPDDTELLSVIEKTYPLCRKADCNDFAVTLTGIDLDAKKQALLEVVLQKPFIVRSIIHLHWENDLSSEQIAELIGENVKYVNSVLNELSESLTESLDKRYKDICVRINAEDKLKAYVIRSAATGKTRQFQVKEDAVPVHKWTRKQKIIIIIISAILAVGVCVVIPILDRYIQMRREEGFSQYENVPTEEIFRYTYEASDTLSSD